MTRLDVVVVGRGKVGRTLARAWRDAGQHVALRPGTATHVPPCSLLVLAVPDRALAATAERLARVLVEGHVRAAVHCAGACDAEVLSPLRRAGVAVGQMHPLVSFASPSSTLPEKAAVLVQGDRTAVLVARRVVKVLGGVPLRVAADRTFDATAYHAAAAIVSNGAVALVAAAVRLFAAAGIDAGEAARALGPLLASTGQNVRRLGLPCALTGPVRRGDATTVAGHADRIEAHCHDVTVLFRELVRLQLELARSFPSAERARPEDLDAIERLVAVPSRSNLPARPRARTTVAGRSKGR